MLNADDPETITSLNVLRRTVSSGRPIVIWLGAGVSRWAGLPAWKDLARQMMRDFSRQVASFSNDHAKARFAAGDFPGVFQLCRDCDRALYHSLLVSKLRVDSVPSLYASFIHKLGTIAPLLLLTSNADALLEQSLNSTNVVQRTDLERFVRLCQARNPCLGLLHGTVSSVESLVFTTDDYLSVNCDHSYLHHLQEIFSFSSVLFLGYGLQDRYVLESLAHDRNFHQLFGSGPHFLVTSNNETPDPSVLVIRYSLDAHGDHRGAMTVLDYLSQTIAILGEEKSAIELEPPPRNSALYITDFHPPGQHNTSQTVKTRRTDGFVAEMTVGLGWANGELPSTESHALHDLLVGLLCFDKTYIPLDSLGACINALGEDVTRHLLASEAFWFIHREEEPVVLFPGDELMGSLGVAVPKGEDRLKPQDVSTLIRRHVHANPGYEAEFELFAELIRARVVVIKSSDISIVPNMTRNALLMPHVSKLLGFGEALMPSQAPKWLKFPILRMAHLVQTAHVCRALGIASTRLPFGGAALTSAAFGVGKNDKFVDHYASYVVSGVLKANLEGYVERNPRLLLAILDFRDTQAGIDFRGHVFSSLRREEGTEFGSAVDAGLTKIIPLGVLENARRSLCGFLWGNGVVAQTPAIWSDPSFDDSRTRVWRDFARGALLKLLSDRGEKASSPCLCGSGDPTSKCCLQALRT